MAEVLRYVNTDVSGGAGDGTSLSDAYSSSSACEAAEQADLATAGDTFRAVCYATSGTADSRFTISGWTTGASNYITWEASEDDRAVKTGIDANKYRITGTLSNNGHILIAEDYVRIDYLQIQPTNTDKGYGIEVESQVSGNEIRISNCYIAMILSGGKKSSYGFRVAASLAVVNLWNVVINNWQNGSDPSFSSFKLVGLTVNIYNCVAANGYVGLDRDSGTVNVYNSVVLNHTGDFAGTFNTIDYVASEDGDGTNSISASGSDWGNEFHDPANGDFTALRTGNIFHGGTNNPQSGLFSTDMDGNTYNNPPTVGVDEVDILMHPGMDGLGSYRCDSELNGGLNG